MVVATVFSIIVCSTTFINHACRKHYCDFFSVIVHLTASHEVDGSSTCIVAHLILVLYSQDESASDTTSGINSSYSVIQNIDEEVSFRAFLEFSSRDKGR